MTLSALTRITAKPWGMFEGEEHKDSILVHTGDMDDFCEFFSRDIHTVSQSREEALAAAKLFLAAPQLLKALQDMLASPTLEVRAQAEEAVKKATE